MKRKLLSLCLAFLLVPQSAWAGGEYVDLLEKYGIRSAIQHSRWEKADASSVYLETLEGPSKAAAVLESGGERSLLLFEKDQGNWEWTQTLPDAVCQGEDCYVSAHGGEEWGEDKDVLTLSHDSSHYTTEYYSFRLNGDVWEFECAKHYSYTGDTGDEDFYEQPKRVAYYTWEDGKLKLDYYLEDLYGKLSEEKLSEPGNGYWVKGNLESQTLVWETPITLDNFSMKDFPRDEYSIGWMQVAGSTCDFFPQEESENQHYAVVNNPNPADRLNLREAPEKTSDYLGKYYNGTRVRVLERREDGWVKVFLLGNDCVGYMREEYLAFGEEMDKVQNACPVFTAPEKEWKLLYAPFDESNVKESFFGGETFEVLGIVEGWWHIQVEGNEDWRGYIREYTSLK